MSVYRLGKFGRGLFGPRGQSATDDHTEVVNWLANQPRMNRLTDEEVELAADEIVVFVQHIELAGAIQEKLRTILRRTCAKLETNSRRLADAYDTRRIETGLLEWGKHRYERRTSEECGGEGSDPASAGSIAR